MLPVPDFLLRRGPDDPTALAWLAAHWGTTQALRHVTQQSFSRQAGLPEHAREADGAPVAARPDEAPASIALCFWSADWTPWQALQQLRSAWPELRFDVRPTYDP